ncbi:MAG: hypothetical protein EZS28_022589 [Streblomastix strix]|uniref:Uncharacterized protein n=1 Tax=Streblomastix strix TaxID=222440 RepID=A0A5J4VH41_9EUKA|nr:MAG: hypothetical protein EZS28_022589 [Streblomastix strix]
MCCEHVSFDPAKDIEKAGCGDQGSTDLAAVDGDQGSTDLALNLDEIAGCGDQGSTDPAINLDGLAECVDLGSTDFADQLESNLFHQNSLIKENRMKLKVQDNRIPRKQQHNLEQLIQESLYSPEEDQLTDQETISRTNKRVASIYPIGSLIDYSKSDTFITYHPGAEEEIQETQIKSLLGEHQHPANIPIGGRLTHFVDAWKIIGADAQVIRGIKSFWINTQVPQILERIMTNALKIRSKDSQLALDKLIEKELQEDIIEKVPFSQLKWINRCFAIPKIESGKWSEIM